MNDFIKNIAILKELGLLTIAQSLAHETELTLEDVHVLSDHHSLFLHMQPFLFRKEYVLSGGKPLLDFLDPDFEPADVLARTNLAVFLGAAHSPQFDAMRKAGAVCLVFEPDKAVFRQFLETVSAVELSRQRVFFFVGDPSGFELPIMDILPPGLTSQGFPAFYVRVGLTKAYSRYVAEMIERLEVFHFRHALYRWEGQWGSRDAPGRDITRGLFYDQQYHLLSNLSHYVGRPGISALSGILQGESAIVAAAGPDLSAKIDYIKSLRDKVVLIAVNSALKPLLSAGIEPDFVVINDSSLVSGETLNISPKLKRAVLVGHILSKLPEESFERIVLFGTMQPLVDHPTLRLYGSVLTTGYSLARWMGCERIILIGAQLASEKPGTLEYTPGSLQSEHKDLKAPPKDDPRILFPALYPVRDAAGGQMYTSANFLDVAYWFLDEVARYNVAVINTTAKTIVHGHGVVIDENYHAEVKGNAARILAALELPQRRGDMRQAVAYLSEQQSLWERIRNTAKHVLEHPSPGKPWELEHQCMAAFDRAGVSYLVQRFEDFSYPVFIVNITTGDPDNAGPYWESYFRAVLSMAEQLLEVSVEQAVCFAKMHASGGNGV